MGKEIADETTTHLIPVRGNHHDSAPLVEITAHIRADQALALELLENARRQRSGGDFDKDQLIREALDLLVEKSFVAIRLAGNSTRQDVNRKVPSEE